MGEDFYLRKTVFCGVSDKGRAVRFEISICGDYSILFKEWNDDPESAGYWYDAGDAELYRMNGETGKKLYDHIVIDGDIEGALFREFGCPDGLTRFLEYKRAFGDYTGAEGKD